MADASSGITISSGSPVRRFSAATNDAPALVARLALMDQYSTGVKASIASSRSTTSRSATDCTRPAERTEPVSMFAASSPSLRIRRLISCPTSGLSSGLSLKPTSRSSIRRACCALTSSMSIARSFSNASLTASSVME